MVLQITPTHEQTADIPIIIAYLRQMRVAELLDKHFPTNGNWSGLTLGEVTVIWLTFIVSESNHRLSHVEPWVRANQQTLSRCLGQPVEPGDCNDDRLATVLDYLSVDERWVEFECELNQNVLRVYDLKGRLARVDTTTASAFVSPEGFFQLGHSKDHRPDLPQVKIAMSVLDPLGLPLTTTVVAGNRADDPLYLPEIAKVRALAAMTGLTYVGDSKMAALGTRAEIVRHGDYYLCPLSAKQLSEAELDALLAPVFDGTQPTIDLRLPNGAGAIEQTDEPVALGFERTVEQHGPDQAGQEQHWQERQLVVRAFAFAESQEKNLRERVARAVKQINALDERKQGKPALPDEAAAQAAGAEILDQQRVAGLVTVTIKTETTERTKRRYGARPETTVVETRVRVGAVAAEAAITKAARRLGWRVYATNHRAAELSLEQAVAAYRAQYVIEQGFGRLKGHALSLTPLYLQFEQRIIGLICLLTIALRVLVLIQYVVRRNLAKEQGTVKGIYPGQPGRQTKRPTSEMMLRAFQSVAFTQITVNGQTHEHITPLNEAQKRLLKLMGLPEEIYSGLVSKSGLLSGP
jgi:transposase